MPRSIIEGHLGEYPRARPSKYGPTPATQHRSEHHRVRWPQIPPDFPQLHKTFKWRCILIQNINL
jgi:hypothetical protein